MLKRNLISFNFNILYLLRFIESILFILNIITSKASRINNRTKKIRRDIDITNKNSDKESNRDTLSTAKFL